MNNIKKMIEQERIALELGKTLVYVPDTEELQENDYAIDIMFYRGKRYWLVVR